MTKQFVSNFLVIGTILSLCFSCQKELLNQKEVPTTVKTAVEYTFKTSQDSSNVSLNLAEKVALLFSKNNRIANKHLRNSYREVKKIITIPDMNNEPAIYAINYKGGGYLLLSATEKETPVLGYSEKGHFKPKNVSISYMDWLFDRMHQVQTFRNDKNYKVPKKVEVEWAYYKQKGKKNKNTIRSTPSTTTEILESYGPLLSSKWRQGSPYNDKTPNIGCSDYNGRAPVGCVALAAAKVARFHSYGGNYSWSIMEDKLYDSDSGTPKANEVAQLLRDVGDVTGMDYDCEGSGAPTENTSYFFKNNLGYANGGVFEALSINTAKTKVKQDITNDRPVIMEGYRTKYTYTTGWWIWKKTHTGYKDGHTWVCDGYKKLKTTIDTVVDGPLGPIHIKGEAVNDYYHMDWGWGNLGMGLDNNNGWFLMDDIEIKGVTTPKGTNRNYQYKRKYLTNIKPY